MIKFGMKLPEIFTQLVKGYRKVTGRDPEGLDLIRIRQESMRRFEDMNKVVDMEGRTLDPSKAITGGTQEDAAFKSGIMKATRTKPKEVETKGLSDKEFRSEKTSFRLNIGKNSPQFNQDLAKRIINKEIYTDLSDSQRKQFLDDLDFVLKNPRDGNAQGGRIGLKEGTKQGIFETLFYNKSAPILSAFNTSELFDLVTTLSSGIPGLAEGGRINYAEGPKDPRRRGFMKAAMGIASMLPFGIGKGIKLAKPAVEKAAEITGPALQKIIETVNQLGRVISVSGRRVKEMITKKKYKDIEVEEDVGDGSFIIKKGDKEIYYKPGRMDETGGVEDDIIEVIESRIDRQSGGVAMMLGE